MYRTLWRRQSQRCCSGDRFGLLRGWWSQSLRKGYRKRVSLRAVSSVLAVCGAMLSVPCILSRCLTSDLHTAGGNRSLHSARIPSLLSCLTAFSRTREAHSSGKGTVLKCLKLPFPGEWSSTNGCWELVDNAPATFPSEWQFWVTRTVITGLHSQWLPVSHVSAFPPSLTIPAPHSFFLELSSQINFIHVSPCLKL